MPHSTNSNSAHRWVAAAALLVSILWSNSADAQTQGTSEPTFPNSKNSGLMFGDYFWFYQLHRDHVGSADQTPIPELHGLWFRRLYFTYDFAYSEKLSTRFRLEANSNGEFEDGDIVPYVKDALLKWAYS